MANDPPETSDPEEQGRLLLQLAARVTGTLDLQDVLDGSLAALRELIDFDGGAIQMIEDGHLVAAATDPPISDEARTVRIPVGVGISGGIAETGRSDYLPDITLDERIPEEARNRGVSGGVRSYFGVPLILQGFPVGVLQIDSSRVDAFGPRERALVLAFTPTITSAVQNAWLFEQERELTAKLKATDQLKRDFISIVSHELRTPLTIVQGMSGTIVELFDSLEAQEVVLLAQRTHAAAGRLRRLIEDLLYAADLDRGFLAVHLVPVDIASVLAAVEAECANGPCPITLDVQRDLPLVLGDADRLHQVFINLIANAEKFAPAGTPITLRAHADGAEVIVAVEDHGPGIAAADRERIFQLFFQSGEVDKRATGGLGIGLFVVQRLCEAMHATVGVGDVEGGGTRFTIHLPAGPAAEEVSTPDHGPSRPLSENDERPATR